MNKDIRIIKRYQNRKLYDTQQSCYVTLEEIAQIIREGHDIKVLDNKSNEDITYATQIQVLFDLEKKSSRHGDVELLKKVILATDGTFTSYIKSIDRRFGDHNELRAPFHREQQTHGTTSNLSNLEHTPLN